MDSRPATGVTAGALGVAAASVCAEGGVDLAWHLLENFHFTEFEVKAKGEVEGDIAFDFALKGSNPNVCGNHPIEFNLAVELPLASLLRSFSEASAIPGTVERALREDTP
jgi:hypothetical protein